VFRHGGNQAVRLPEGFELPGIGEVRVRRCGNGLLLEPGGTFDVDAWFRRIDEVGGAGFLEGWERDQALSHPRRTSTGELRPGQQRGD
jgi:virulence-associated protein VagC